VIKKERYLTVWVRESMHVSEYVSKIERERERKRKMKYNENKCTVHDLSVRTRTYI
jgi:hypothetical protein